MSKVAMWEHSERVWQRVKAEAEEYFIKGLRAGMSYRQRYQHYAIPTAERIAEKFIEDAGLGDVTYDQLASMIEAFSGKIRAKATTAAETGAINHMLAIHFNKDIKRFSTVTPIERNMQWLSIA